MKDSFSVKNLLIQGIVSKSVSIWVDFNRGSWTRLYESSRPHPVATGSICVLMEMAVNGRDTKISFFVK